MGKTITGSGELDSGHAKVQGLGRAIKSADAFIQIRTKLPAGAEAPDVLYHYTSAEGLIGILQSGEIWATSIRHLSDTSEFTYTLQRAEQASTQNALSEHFLFETFLLQRFNGDTLLDNTSFFVGSFSAEGNLLSQWRAYCPTGGGYSIGFKRADLQEQAGKTFGGQYDGEPYRLVRCEYDINRQLDALRDLFEEARRAHEERPDEERERIDRYLRGFDEEMPDWLFQYAVEFFKALSTLAPAFKDPAFREEAEWRVLSPLVLGVGKQHHFRAGKYCVIPYMKFSLPGRGESLKVEEIVIGPTENPNLARGAIKQLCQLCGVPSVTVRYSDIPFRHWDSK
ncbi:MAG: DUF2971 domain-containing protein [Woeseiaceae bacterium]